MRVKEVTNYRDYDGSGKLEGWCDVVFDISDGIEMVVTSCAVINGENGKYVTFPSRKTSKGKYVNVVYFRTGGREIRDDFSTQVLALLEEYKSGSLQKNEDDDLPF